MNGWDIVIWAVAGVLAAGVAWLAWEIRHAPLDPAGHDDPASLAWGPGVPVLVRLPRRIGLDPCGCLWLEGGLWSPCIDHDPEFDPPVGQWAKELDL